MAFFEKKVILTLDFQHPKENYDFDVIYLDECHSLKFSHGDFLSLYDKMHKGTIIGLTGTYPKFKKSEKWQMCNRFCPKVYTYSVDDAVDEKILNDYRIVVHKLQLSAVKNITKKKKNGETFQTSELKQYQYWTTRLENATTEQERYLATIQRMKELQSFPGKEIFAKNLLQQQTDKTIIFATGQDQADRLCKHSYHSKNKASDRNLVSFTTGDILYLSAVEQLSEGITIPNLKCGIILHAYANNRKANQKIGRMLRLNPDDTATIHILCYENSIDYHWVKQALESLNQSKITWIEAK
jgi:superfamily II DNA or RNA helicase